MHPRRSRVVLPILLALCALAPTAQAFEAGLDVRSPDPLTLRGEVAARAPGGVLWLNDTLAQGEYVVEAVRGVVTLHTFVRHEVEAGGVRTQRTGQPPREESYPVENATLRFRLAGERFEVALVPNGTSESTVRGRAAGEGVVSWLERAVQERTDPILPRGGETSRRLNWRWEAGWAFLGSLDREVPLRGFPQWEAPRLDVRGDVVLQAEGGNLTFVDRDGVARSLRLGTWVETDPSFPGTAATRAERVSRVFFEGTAGGADVGLGASWGLGAPAVAYEVEGEALWRRASGALRQGASEVRFDEVDVRGSGVFALAPEPPGLQPLAGGAYAVAGDWERLQVGAVRVSPPPAPVDPVRPAMGLTLLAALAWLLTENGRTLAGRAFALFYTRFSHEELLAHGTRRRIFELVSERPGIHLRELHRETGGAWGAFAFHVGMLLQARYLETRREGRYKAVFPAGGASQVARSVRHPLARRILDALPPDGSPSLLRALPGAVGASRQLVGYHLRALERSGLVATGSTPRGERTVRRRIAQEQDQA